LDNFDLAFAADTAYYEPGSPMSWFGTTLSSFDGMDSARSLPLTDPSVETNFRMTTSLEGPGVLDFIWRVESEGGDGILWLNVSNNETSFSRLAQITGNSPWTPESIGFGQGTHRVHWHVNKNETSFGQGQVIGYVDQVIWSTATPEPTHTPTVTPTPSISPTTTHSPTPTVVPWDLKPDGKVDLFDLIEFLSQFYGYPPSEGAQSADQGPPEGVDFLDLLLILLHWQG
jgi:hypothetical protein